MSYGSLIFAAFNQLKLFAARHFFDHIFTPHGIFFCVEAFKIDKGDRTPCPCVFGTAAAVMGCDSFFKMVGPACV